MAGAGAWPCCKCELRKACETLQSPGRSSKFVTVKRVNKVSQLIVHCCSCYVCHLVASAGNQYEIYEATRTWTAPRHAPTCAIPAVSGSASGLSPLKVKYKYSAQRQIKIIKKYYTLVAFPAPPPPSPSPLCGSEKGLQVTRRALE